jgi:hypothetical protein
MKESRTGLKAIVRHVALPAVAPVAIVGLYFTPVLLFGCVNRGLLALAIVGISAIAACVTTGKGVRAKAQGLPSANLWLLSTLILLMPIALVVGPLG